MKLALKLFLLPGNLAADLIGASKPDDRETIRTMIDMLFWGTLVVVGAMVAAL